MKKLVIITALIIIAFPAFALAHGGGCRKDSPAGKCCHAGSQPYHCH